ncbi:MAG: hypothetical protein BAJALOKI1v1_330011 [Promethearchaeota archaeon]|nr:MAG: hypothetical protein BAJALOKI1v1_330011 [Candidatus Lokiarchaeota archaeon]
MLNKISEKSIFSRDISLIKKFSNEELKLYKYFHEKTTHFPESVVIIDNFIFFFVKSHYYFSCSSYITSIRQEIPNKKVLIIRSEKTLIRQIFSLFPDLYIHDVQIKGFNSKGIVVSVYILTFKDRGIAIGREGSYIKAVNKLFNRAIKIQECDIIFELECQVSIM